MDVRKPAAAAAAFLVAFLPVALANHSQTLPGGGTITFKDKAGGNEWWVEAVVTSSSPISKVEVMDDGGAWAAMTHRPEWGSWALSYHVEPGHRVTFRATTAAGTTTSCPFTHPAGTEQCGAPPPAWTSRLVSDVGGAFGGNDIAVGDGDNDGSQEVYVPTSNSIQVMRWTSSGWARSAFGQEFSNYGAIAVGDGNNDGKREVWGAALNRVVMFEWSGTTWVKKVDLSIQADMSISSITLGDIDDDGRRELYFGEYGQDSSLYMVTFNGYIPTVRNLGTVSGSTAALWVGDGDGSGDLELAVATEFKGTGSLYLADFDAATGVANIERVAEAVGVQGITAGDGNGDGRGEVFAASSGIDGPMVTMSRKAAGVWTTTTIATLSGYSDDLAMGDADNDGKQELYVSSNPLTGAGHLVQVRWTGSAWAKTDLGAVAAGQAAGLAVGDGDNDAKREVYTVASTTATCCENMAVYQVSDHPPAPRPGGFDATFTGVRGNEWWIQANVATNGPAITKVEVTLDGGASFKPLAKQSWGPTAWAASHHIVQGTVVQLRATSSTGQTDLSSCRQWIPPSGQDAAIVACGTTPPPPPPPPPTFQATFSNVKGNDYWVEAVIKANEQIHGVFLTFDCDPNQEPHDMSYNSDWGKWALGGIRIPTGARVTMFAFGDHGGAESGGYIWPQATPTSGCPSGPDWPRHGSFVEYEVYKDLSGGGTSETTRGTLRLTFVVPPEPFAANWESTCSGTTTRRAADGTTTVESWSGPSAVHPPRMTRTPRVGFQADWANQPSLPSTMQTASQYCLADDGADWRVTATGEETKTMRVLGPDGQPRTMTVWHAQNDGNADSEDRVVEWETRVGLVLHWERTGRMSGMAHFGGDLIRTDAPIG